MSFSKRTFFFCIGDERVREGCGRCSDNAGDSIGMHCPLVAFLLICQTTTNKEAFVPTKLFLMIFFVNSHTKQLRAQTSLPLRSSLKRENSRTRERWRRQ